MLKHIFKIIQKGLILILFLVISMGIATLLGSL